MSRCRRTDTLVETTVAGIGLTHEDAAHARDCAECAHALALARRFEGSLSAAAAELSPEPMPSMADLAAAGPSDAGGASMTFPKGKAFAATAAGAALVLAIVAGVGTFAPRLFAPAAGGGASPEEVNAWLDTAVAAAVEVGGRNERSADWQPYQVEVCGSHAIAFFVERDPTSVRPFRWAIGTADANQSVMATGIAGSLMDADVARARAQLPLCSVFVDRSLGEEAARDALAQAREHWQAQGGPVPIHDLRGTEVVDMAPMTRELYSVLVERPDGARTWVERITLSLDEGLSISTQAMDSGVARPQVAYRASGPPTDYFGLIDDSSVVALELFGAKDRVRYSVGAPGFILQWTVPSGQLHRYRFLDARGQVVAEGDIAPWPPNR